MRAEAIEVFERMAWEEVVRWVADCVVVGRTEDVESVKGSACWRGAILIQMIYGGSTVMLRGDEGLKRSR